MDSGILTVFCQTLYWWVDEALSHHRNVLIILFYHQSLFRIYKLKNKGFILTKKLKKETVKAKLFTSDDFEGGKPMPHKVVGGKPTVFE